jgi:hypothetical protein
MHSVASGADSAILRIAIVWLAVNHGCPAVFAVFDRHSVNHLRSLKGNLKCHDYDMKKGPKFSLRAFSY